MVKDRKEIDRIVDAIATSKLDIEKVKYDFETGKFFVEEDEKTWDRITNPYFLLATTIVAGLATFYFVNPEGFRAVCESTQTWISGLFATWIYKKSQGDDDNNNDQGPQDPNSPSSESSDELTKSDITVKDNRKGKEADTSNSETNKDTKDTLNPIHNTDLYFKKKDRALTITRTLLNSDLDKPIESILDSNQSDLVIYNNFTNQYQTPEKIRDFGIQAWNNPVLRARYKNLTISELAEMIKGNTDTYTEPFKYPTDYNRFSTKSSSIINSIFQTSKIQSESGVEQQTFESDSNNNTPKSNHAALPMVDNNLEKVIPVEPSPWENVHSPKPSDNKHLSKEIVARIDESAVEPTQMPSPPQTPYHSSPKYANFL